MSRVSTYLNFQGDTEEAFGFYATAFGTSIERMMRMKEMGSGGLEVTEAEQELVGHIELPILAGHVLMGTDMLESMGHHIRVGNNVTINLEPDTREETDRLYAALSQGGGETSGLMDMPWGYWGTALDRYGVRWMFNCYEAAS